MAHFPHPASSDIRKLQYWWLGFAVLVAGGWVAARIKYYGYTGSLLGALAFRSGFAHTAQHEFMGFMLLLLVSCTARKAVWWLAVGRIGYKAAALLLFFWNTFHPPMYFYDKDALQYSCVLLHLEPVGWVLGEPFRILTLPALYAYWLFLCFRILRTPDALPAPCDGNASATST